VLCNWFAPKLMNSPHISYAPHPEATQETEIAALAAIYRLVVNRQANRQAMKEAVPENRLDDAKESDVSRHKHHNR
jgi:hypothetical protein